MVPDSESIPNTPPVLPEKIFIYCTTVQIYIIKEQTTDNKYHIFK